MLSRNAASSGMAPTLSESVSLIAGGGRGVIGSTILQVVEHLQGGAQRVGSRPGGPAFAVQIEQLAADRRCRVAAILHQIVPVAVAQLGCIEAKRPEHVMAMLRRDASD